MQAAGNSNNATRSCSRNGEFELVPNAADIRRNIFNAFCLLVQRTPLPLLVSDISKDSESTENLLAPPCCAFQGNLLLIVLCQVSKFGGPVRCLALGTCEPCFAGLDPLSMT